MSVRPSPHAGPPESRTLRGAASKCSKPSKYLGPIPQRTERPEEGQLRAPRAARCPDALVLAGVLGAFLYALDARVLDEELGAVLKSAGLPTHSCSYAGTRARWDLHALDALVLHGELGAVTCSGNVTCAPGPKQPTALISRARYEAVAGKLRAAHYIRTLSSGAISAIHSVTIQMS